MKSERYDSDHDSIDPACDRELLIAYLEYAVGDVAAHDPTSATLLELAIAQLREPSHPEDLGRYHRRLC